MNSTHIPFYCFPLNVQNLIFGFDNELKTKISLNKLRDIQRKIRELKRKEYSLKDEIDNNCPHKKIRRESNGDYHNHGWDKYCVLCNKYIH